MSCSLVEVYQLSVETCCLIFYPEDGRSRFLQTVVEITTKELGPTLRIRKFILNRLKSHYVIRGDLST